jgi:hypothetical protein
MTKYLVHITAQVSVPVEVEADNREQADTKAHSDFMKRPITDDDYVDASAETVEIEIVYADNDGYRVNADGEPS